MGLFGSRIDQYTVSIMLPKEELGKFNVLKSLLIYTHAGMGFILLPFVKNIYRLPDKVIDKLARRLLAFGLIAIIPYTAAIYIVITYIYNLSFHIVSYVYASLLVLPSTYYTLLIYKFFKKDKQSKVVALGFTAAALSLLLNVLLIPSLHIDGSLLAGICSQWTLLTLLIIFDRKEESRQSF